jgi:hypothetical protein
VEEDVVGGARRAVDADRDGLRGAVVRAAHPARGGAVGGRGGGAELILKELEAAVPAGWRALEHGLHHVAV